jgi:transcriptional regulator with XRE-family HTH domain
MVLFRRLLGEVLRRHRQQQSRTLRDVAAAARVSLGYLSEVERGRKEASSELLAAVCAALGVSLAEVLREVSDDIAAVERRTLRPVSAVGSLSPLAAPAVPLRVASRRPVSPRPVPAPVPAVPTPLPVRSASVSALPVVAA